MDAEKITVTILLIALFTWAEVKFLPVDEAFKSGLIAGAAAFTVVWLVKTLR
jgi:anaerobic C4-dicarboxylate transporter